MNDNPAYTCDSSPINKQAHIGTAACGGCCTKISGLSVPSGGAKIISDVNLHFHCGEFSVVAGPNGAGKTTLLRAIAGELPFSGEILFHRSGSGERVRPRIGYVPQTITFDSGAPISVEDLFALSLSLRPRWLFRERGVRQTAVDSLASVDAAHLISRKLGCLSGGELQRVILSLALTPRPDILLLDESVSGIDAAGLNLFYAMISELRERYDLSIVMVSHDLRRSAQYADRLIFFNRTVIRSGVPGDVLNDDRVKRFYGMDACEEGISANVRNHHQQESALTESEISANAPNHRQQEGVLADD